MRPRLVLVPALLVLTVLALAFVPTTTAQLPTTTLEPGELVITEIMKDPTHVPDASGEWFEVMSLADRLVDLGGLVVRDDGTDAFVVPGPLLVSFGERVVFGRSADPAANGGVPVDHAYGAAMVLSNADDEIVLVWDGVVIDRVAYDDGVTFPDVAGAAMALDPSREHGGLNDDGAAWCEATTPYGDGDLGTPGAVNDGCDLGPIPTPELAAGWFTAMGAGLLGLVVRVRRGRFAEP